MAQTVGYLIASLGPLGIGLLHSTPNPLLASTVWLIALALTAATFGTVAGQNEFVEGEAALT
jgi:cyanate permease